MKPFQVSSMLSEINPDEYHANILVRKHNRSYGDEQNVCRMPSGITEAGEEI